MMNWKLWKTTKNWWQSFTNGWKIKRNNRLIFFNFFQKTFKKRLTNATICGII